MDLPLVLASGFVVSWLIVQRGIVSWDAYHEALRLQTRDAWMRAQCENETFFANMRVHSDVCEIVQRSASRTPLLHALHSAMEPEPFEWLLGSVCALGLAKIAWDVTLLYYKRKELPF